MSTERSVSLRAASTSCTASASRSSSPDERSAVVVLCVAPAIATGRASDATTNARMIARRRTKLAALQLGLGLVETLVRFLHEAGNLVFGLAGLDRITDGGGDQHLELLVELRVALLERSLDQLEVLEIGGAHQLLGFVGVSLPVCREPFAEPGSHLGDLRDRL